MRLAGITFSGRCAALAYVGATGWVQQLSALPSLFALCTGIAVLVVAGGCAYHFGTTTFRRYSAAVLMPLLIGSLGFSVAVFAATQRLADQLPQVDENRVSKVVFKVVELPRLRPDSRQFVAHVLESRPEGVPQRVLINWAAPGWAGPYAETKQHDFPELYPGQIWQANLTIKTPHASLNPHQFDYESYLFAQGIRAVASVRGSPRLLEVEPAAKRSASLLAESLRYSLRKKMLPFLEGMRYGGVITALSLGDQASIHAKDWEIFNRSGLTHLVSISGAHVTLIAALVAGLANWLWRRLCFGGISLSEWLPAQTLAAFIAVVVAGIYCVIAGWGVPAQRTFLMLCIVIFSYLWRLPLQGSQVLAIAAIAVLMLDPWAILSSGFWLSFGAVGVLFACNAWQGTSRLKQVGVGRFITNIKTASVWQLLITAALFPPLALMFNEISLISPLSNAYAIPVVSLLITPLSLLLAASSMFSVLDPFSSWVAWCCHALIELMMWPTVWLCELAIASIPVAQAPTWCFVLALLGVMGAMSTKAIKYKNFLWLLLLPYLFWGRERLQQGEWYLTALDVGQGSAIVIRTAHSVMVFDTGLRRSRESDVGGQTIHPYLRSKGLNKIDLLVVSHADLDHVGGTASLLQRYAVEQSYSSFDLKRYINREERLLGLAANSIALPTVTSACTQGVKWQVDGVYFEFLWPQSMSTMEASSAERNAKSCVLSIRGPWHSALLMGDTGRAEELVLMEQNLAQHDVVLVGHHGSSGSSSLPFIEQVRAQVAIAQAGWWSRFGHPQPTVQKQWLNNNAAFYRTDFDGAVSVYSSSTALRVDRERLRVQRYWHNHNAHQHLSAT